MSHPHAIPRRKFLAASISALGLAPMILLRAQQGAANDEIAIGLVGCGGQGWGVTNNFLNMQGSKQPVNWDPKAEKVIGNDEQAKHPRLGARLL